MLPRRRAGSGAIVPPGTRGLTTLYALSRSSAVAGPSPSPPSPPSLRARPPTPGPALADPGADRDVAVRGGVPRTRVGLVCRSWPGEAPPLRPVVEMNAPRARGRPTSKLGLYAPGAGVAAWAGARLRVGCLLVSMRLRDDGRPAPDAARAASDSFWSRRSSRVGLSFDTAVDTCRTPCSNPSNCCAALSISRASSASSCSADLGPDSMAFTPLGGGYTPVQLCSTLWHRLWQEEHRAQPHSAVSQQ